MKLLEALASVKTGVFSRFDAWVNLATGFGSSRDKSTYGQVLQSRLLTDQQLSALYHSDDMAARMVDIVPQEMLREPFCIETGDADLDTIAAEKQEQLNLREKLVEAIRWARCYGGSALLLGADDGRDAALPLDAKRAEDLKYVYVIDRRFLWPLSYYDTPGHPKLGEVKTYMVTSIGGHTQTTDVVHESRLVLFRGAPTGAQERQLLSGWEMSTLQRPFDVLRQFNTGWASVETLLTDGNQAVFKMTGLAEAIASGGESALRMRLQIMDLYRSVMRALVIDADSKEEFSRHTVSFSDIPATLDKFILRLAAAAEMPVTILMGQSPAGMNATGESDFRWFYDRIRSQQTTYLGPRIRRVMNVWSQTRAGQKAVGKKLDSPGTLKVKFAPLWTETPLVQAQTRKTIAEADALYITAQALMPDEVALARFRPEGYDTELQLSEESIKARETALSADLGALALPKLAEGQPVDGTAPTSATLTLTSSDIATITKVNEARASVGLTPLPAPDGNLTMPAYKAKYASAIAEAATAEAGGETAAPPGRFDATGARLFELHRNEDETGVSGTGLVAEGAVFEDGTCVLRWKTNSPGTTIFGSVEHMLKVHGHGGKTEMRYLLED